MEIHWRNPNGLDDEERAAAEQRLQELAGGHSDLIDLWIDVARTPHHRKGAEEVTIRCQARGTELIAHGRHAETPLALREALQTFQREVKRLRERRRDRRAERLAEPPARGVVDAVFRDEGHGFVLTDSGDRVYFHRNSVSAGLDFETLTEGQSVALGFEAGEKGLQATFVAPAAPER
ncbi:MAG: cold shock domain-containing protein [Myxococcota bacterium]